MSQKTMSQSKPVRFQWAAAPHFWMNDDWPSISWKEASVTTCLEDIATAGFDGCEYGHIFHQSEGHLHSLLDTYNLQFCNRWHEFRLLENDLNEEKVKFESYLGW